MKFFKKKFFPNQIDSRGQAALTDSLFFLAIVAMLCTLLFYFIINYGITIEDQINSFYSSDFAMDTLKVIAYVNVMRDGNSIYADEGPDPQYDYLLTMIKEDYSQTSAAGSPYLSPPTKKAIANTVHTVMKPFEHSVDYAFYFFQEDSQKFLFLLIGLHECIKDESGVDCKVDDANRIVGSERRMYYCLPPIDSPTSATVLKDKVFPYTGKVDSAASKIFLAKSVKAADGKINVSGGANYVMELDLWVSKDITSLRSLESDSHKADFNCMLVNRSDYEDTLIPS
ncbi:MAG: hypothetical protein WC308_01950 [archaeon]|jgi:hypothetical protein